MKVFIVMTRVKNGWQEYPSLRKIFSTKEKAEEYIKSVDVIDKEFYDYEIIEREVF